MIGTPTTGLVIDKRVPGAPGTHALIVGISAYPHLPGGAQPPTPQHFGLRQLSFAARSALLFHDWLVNRAQLAVPLATCRLLLGPSPGEAEDPRIPPQALNCTTDDFVLAATAWIEDARRSDAEMTIFYFVGHALQASRDEDLLLFQNFGSSIGPSFRGAVSFANIFNGMAPSGDPIAQTQLYFVDGGRHPVTRPDLGPRLFGTTDVFDVLLSGPDRRSAAVFHAAAPGDPAFGRAGGVALFTQALVEGLEGAAAAPQGSTGLGGSEWGVTITSLSRWLSVAGQRLAAEHNIPITFMTSGLLRDGLISRIKDPPAVAVDIQVEPAEAAAVSELLVEDHEGKAVANFAPPAALQRVRLRPGFYALTIMPADPRFKTQRRLVQIVPPVDSPIVMDVSG